jgi:hypothetical protein
VAEPDLFSLSCLSCVTSVRVSTSGGLDLVGSLRAFFVRHADCQTTIDLADVRARTHATDRATVRAGDGERAHQPCPRVPRG